MRQVTIPNTLKITSSNAELIEELKALKLSDVCVVYSSLSKKLLAKEIIDALNAKHELYTEGQAFTREDLDTVAAGYPGKTTFIGVGGGTVLDIAKYLAARSSDKFISVPTLVSHDGICSPVAVINGKSLGAVMPTAILVPLHIIKESPINYIYAGIGDLISNLSAIADWQLATKAGKDHIDDFSYMLSSKAARDIVLTLELANSHGLKPEEFLRSDKFLRLLVESLNLAGIAMSIAGSSRPCSGAEHMISHAIDEIYGSGTKALHGIQVAIATLYLSYYRNDDLKELAETLRAIGFPTQFSDIGISEAELSKILELAPKTRAGRYTILEEI